MELDRQRIERRDFPIVRRGYDPATVDAHLRALSAALEELQREASSSSSSRGPESLASLAATQVQGIIEAAQASAVEIERAASEEARQVRAQAGEEAARTREEAIARAQGHVAAVAQSAEALLARVGTMDSETGTLIESLRGGASRLAGDLAAVEGEMGLLYDAAAGRTGAPEHAPAEHAPVPASTAPSSLEQSFAAAALPAQPVGGQPGSPNGEAQKLGTPQPVVQGEQGDEYEYEEPSMSLEVEEAAFAEQVMSGPASTSTQEDLDGARLVALNMALNGDSREQTGRYLAENYELPDRERLLDEVYAAIEG